MIMRDKKKIKLTRIKTCGLKKSTNFITNCFIYIYIFVIFICKCRYKGRLLDYSIYNEINVRLIFKILNTND